MPVGQIAIADLKLPQRWLKKHGNDDFEDLKASIKANGVLKPILLRPNGTILDGKRRVFVADICSLKTVSFITVKDA